MVVNESNIASSLSSGMENKVCIASWKLLSSSLLLLDMMTDLLFCIKLQRFTVFVTVTCCSVEMNWKLEGACACCCCCVAAPCDISPTLGLAGFLADK